MEHFFVSKKTFRYEINSVIHPKHVLIVLHGYGQLAKFFILKFASIQNDWLIVAPEGMHRFYLNGTTGRVGASWMTKEARESDIIDNVYWLEELKTQIDSRFGNLETHVLGFSQGGATAARWMNSTRHDIKSLCLWACVFPPDLEKLKAPLSIQKKYFVIGSDDEFYNHRERESLSDNYKKLDFSIIEYDGKHDINSEVIAALYNQHI